MAEEGEEESAAETVGPAFPSGRVKKIMKLDKDINKITSEAIFLVSRSTELFIEFLAEKSARVSIEKKRKTVKFEHLRVAVKRHQPTRDFLLDSLPLPLQSQDTPPVDHTRNLSNGRPAPAGTRRIDAFFQKCS